MAQPETLYQVLAKSMDASRVQQLHTVHEAIKASLSGQQPGSRVGLETLVVCAEAALKVGSLDVAQDCLERYFLEQRRYGANMAPVELRDQYLCRAHFARGLLVSGRSKGLKGRELIDGTLEALSHVMAGLEVAAANLRYQFLVYNASVHHWRVAAPLHRDGLRNHLLPSTERVVQALDKVPGHEEWKVRCYTALALCQADVAVAAAAATGPPGTAGGGSSAKASGSGGVSGASFDDALRTLQRAYDTAGAAKLTELQRDVARLQVHFSTQAQGAGALKPAKPTGPSAPAGKAGAKGAKGAPPPAPTLDEEGALRLIQGVLTGRPDRAIAEAQLKDAVAKVDPAGPGGRVKGALLRPVSRAAWAAAHAGLPVLAERWAGRAAASSDSGPRTWSEMTRVLLTLQALGPTGDTSLAPAVVSAHVKALEQLEDCLTTFTKLADVEGIHAAARLAWNAGLLLLQPPLRRNVKRAFNAAARALAVASSPLTRLRAALHLEAAKCDAAEEALIKAGQEVGKALSLDYLPTPAEAVAVPWLARPLDRWAAPLSRALALRTSAEPADTEEEALSLIERSKESRNPAIKADLLARAREKLSSLPPLPPPAATDPSGPERSAAHEAARRRISVWAELVRSAAATRMDEHVLAAAPYALAAEWSPVVDREMALLQAQLSFLEAEAAISSLKRQRADLAPPLTPTPPLVDDEGVRRLPANMHQLQELVVLATVRAMHGATSVSEPWLTINSAVQLYNAAMPYMQLHRYADLYRWLRPVAEALVALSPADSDGPLVVAVAEALGRAAEHRLLLAAVKAKGTAEEGKEVTAEEDGAGGEGEGEEGDEEADAASSPPGDAGPHFSRRSPGYLPLPDARMAAAGLQPRTFPSLAGVVGSLAVVTKVAEAALERAGSAFTQGLLEMYARLQQYRGVAAGLPPGAAAASESTSRVVAAIEALYTAARAGRAAGGVAAEAAAAMALLRGLPGGGPLELWAKTARAAAEAGCWPAALESSAAALAAIPGASSEGGLDPLALESPSDVPEMTPAAWFWSAVAATARASGLLALADTGTQGAATALSVRREALATAVQGARWSAFVNKSDLCEAASRVAWNASLPFISKPLLRAALIRPLGVAVEALNRVGATDKRFQVRLNCLYVEALCAAKRWGDAVAACDAAGRAIKPRSLLRPLLGWKSAALAALGRNVPAEMTKVKEHPSETQAYAWSVLAHHSAARYDQVAAHRAALMAVGEAGWLKAVALAGYAEWMLSSNDDKEEAEDALLAAADALLEFDTGDLDNDGSDDEQTEPHKRSPGRGGNASRNSFRKVFSRSFSRSASMDGARSQDGEGGGSSGGGGVSGGGSGSSAPDPNRVPEELGSTHLERLARIYVMACQAASTASDSLDYMLAAHHNFMRLLTQALHSAAHTRYIAARDAYHLAVAAAAVEGRPPPPEPTLPKPHALLPDTLVGWGTWQLTPELISSLTADADAGSLPSLSPSLLPQPALTLAYLELLMTCLRGRGLACHCLGLLQLQRVLAKTVMMDEGMYVATSLGLVSALDELGLSAEAGALEEELGGVADITPEEEAAAKEQAELAALVRTAAKKLEAARPRSALAVGRLSFLASGMRRAAAAAANAAAAPQRPSSGAAGTETAEAADAAAAAEFSAAGGGRGGGGRDATPTPAADGNGLDSEASGASTETAESTAAAADPLPYWLEEAARDLGNVNLVSGGGLLSHITGQLLLRPYTLHDVWLKKGEFLARRGHYAVARRLLTRARSHAADCGNREAEARCLLALSRAELAAANPAEAVMLVQAAQRLGGDIDFWADLLVQYVDCRVAGQHSTTSDAKEALQGGVSMFLALARDDRSAERAASAARAILRLRLARLLMHDMDALRAQGVSTWRKCYEQATTHVNAAIVTLAAREEGIPHVEGLLVQAELMQADPTHVKDLRPRLKKVEKVLLNAEEQAVKLHSDATPRDLDRRVVSPTARLLARVRVALAEVQLEVARERERLAAADREKARPKFPKIRGQDAQAVVEFIDEAGGGPPPPPGLTPEDSALAAATGAAALVAASPGGRARALLTAGCCLQFKFLNSAPPEMHPLRPFVPPDPPPPTPASNVTTDAGADADAAGDTTTADGNGGEVLLPPAAAAEAAAAAAAATPAGAAALQLQAQAAATLSAALEAALSIQDWSLAEKAALELVVLYGQTVPGLACRSLALVQACRSAASGFALLRAAAPPQQPEVLAAAARDALAAALPVPQDNLHYAMLRRVVAGVRGGSVARLDVAAAPPVERQLAVLPPDLRVLILYFSPDGQHLYAAALNLPPPGGQPPGLQSDKSRKALSRDAPAAGGPSGSSRLSLLHRVDVTRSSAEALRAGFRGYRRGVERQIRESISAAAARGIGVPVEEDAAPSSPSRKGAKGASKQPAAAKGAKQGAGASSSSPHERIFDPLLNQEWSRMLQEFEEWMAPLVPWLEAAVPPLPAPAQPPPDAKKQGKGAAPTGPIKHKVALLVDPCMDGLPWEALPHLAATCATVSRASSLQALAACHIPPSSDPDAPPPTGPVPLPPLDLGRVTTLLDPRHECSSPAQAVGPYMLPLIPALTAPELASALPAVNWWTGLSGEPNRAPGPESYAGILSGASSLLFLGVGRFASHVPPSVLATADLSSCDAALLFDRCNTDAAYWAQLYRDNRKRPEARRLESPGRVAALLLAKGVRTVVVTPAAVAPAVAVRFLNGVLMGLVSGRSIGEVVYGMLTGGALDEYELLHLRANLQVWGAPGLLGQVLTQGPKGGSRPAKGAAPTAKK